MENKKEITRNSYDATAIEYQANTLKLHPEIEIKVQCFLSHLSSKSKILDLGCGPGRDAKYFVQMGYSVVGIDLSSKMIDIAQASIPEAEFLVADIENFSFVEKTFDAVWASASLLHVPKQTLPQIIDKIHNCLKTNGIFYLSMKKGTGEEFKPDHRFGGVKKFWAFVEEAELVSILETCGFQILEQDTHDKLTAYQTHPWISVICKK